MRKKKGNAGQGSNEIIDRVRNCRAAPSYAPQSGALKEGQAEASIPGQTGSDPARTGGGSQSALELGTFVNSQTGEGLEAFQKNKSKMPMPRRSGLPKEKCSVMPGEQGGGKKRYKMDRRQIASVEQPLSHRGE